MCEYVLLHGLHAKSQSVCVGPSPTVCLLLTVCLPFPYLMLAFHITFLCRVFYHLHHFCLPRACLLYNVCFPFGHPFACPLLTSCLLLHCPCWPFTYPLHAFADFLLEKKTSSTRMGRPSHNGGRAAVGVRVQTLTKRADAPRDLGKC